MLHCDMDLILADLWAQIPEFTAVLELLVARNL